MAGNTGKFIDRNPIICSAGKRFGNPDETVKNCLKEYTVEDKMQALRHDVLDFERRKCFPYDLPLMQNNRTTGCYNKMRAIIRPEEPTNFQHLIQDLKSTAYYSYWNGKVGRSRDKTPFLPPGMDVVNTTFGKPSVSEYPLGLIVNPQKPYCQVFREAEVGHDLYVKSHLSYYPGEQPNRKYDCHGYDETRTFGQAKNVDPAGVMMKRCMQSKNNAHLSVTSNLQADFIERTAPQVGKVLAPNNNIECVPPGHTFGRYTIPDLYSVGELMRDCEPNMLKKQLHNWMSHVNKIRNLLKSHDFDFYEFYDALRYEDKEKILWLPKETVYATCRHYRVSFDKCRLEPLMELTGILMKGCIDYGKFVDAIHWRVLFHELPVIKDLPPENRYYEATTASAFEIDPKIVDNSKLPVAGIPTLRADQAAPGVDPLRGCKAHYEHLGAESSSRSHLNPSINTQYGLSHRDFLKVRPKEQIQGIFKRIMNISDEHFENIYAEALEMDGGETCVETVRNLIKKYLHV